MHHVIKDILSFQAKNKKKQNNNPTSITFKPLALTSYLIFNVTAPLVGVKYNSEPVRQPRNLNSYWEWGFYWQKQGLHRAFKPLRHRSQVFVWHILASARATGNFQRNTLRSLNSGLRPRATIQQGSRSKLGDSTGKLSVSLCETQGNNKRMTKENKWAWTQESSTWSCQRSLIICQF